MVLFNRLVNLSLIGLQETSAPVTWEQIEGDNAQFFSAGYTSTPQGSKAVEICFKITYN